MSVSDGVRETSQGRERILKYRELAAIGTVPICKSARKEQEANVKEKQRCLITL